MRKISLTKQVAAFLLALVVGIFAWGSPAVAAETSNGAQLFEIHCAGCHPKGGNIIRRGKNLKQQALKRNQMDSLEAIAEIVTHGKNNMSAFGDRLSTSEIQAVSAYVLEQAAADWK